MMKKTVLYMQCRDIIKEKEKDYGVCFVKVLWVVQKSIRFVFLLFVLPNVCYTSTSNNLRIFSNRQSC